MPLDKQGPSVSRRSIDEDGRRRRREKTSPCVWLERIVSLCCARRARALRRRPPRKEREKCRWIDSKKFCRALSPKQIARFRRAERTSLSFPRFRHNCSGPRIPRLGSHRGCDRPVRLPLSRKNMETTQQRNGLVLATARNVDDGARIRLQTALHIGDERAPHIAWALQFPTLNHQYSQRAINMGRWIADSNDDDYVSRFPLALVLFSTRRNTRRRYPLGRKIGRPSSVEYSRTINSAFSTKFDDKFYSCATQKV